MTLSTLRAVLIALSRAQPRHSEFLATLLEALDDYEAGMIAQNRAASSGATNSR